MQIVILGDCAINGNNSIGHLIFNDPSMSLSFSIAYNIRKYKKVSYFRASAKDAIEWYLKNRQRNTKIQLKDLELKAFEYFKKYVKDNKLKNVHHSEKEFADWYRTKTGEDYTQDKAFKLVKEQELSHHWSSMLSDHEVYNYAINGNSYGNYYIRLRKHITEIGLPDLVIMSDFARGHYFAYFKHDSKTHHAVMTYGFMDKSYDETIGYSRHVFEKKKEIFEREMNKSQQYHDRKNHRYRNLLTKYMNANGIPYVDCFYRSYNLKFAEVNSIDFTNLRSTWDGQGYDNVADENDHCMSKLATVKDELKIVTEFITNLKTN